MRYPATHLDDALPQLAVEVAQVSGEFVEDQRECEGQLVPLEASVGGEDRSMA